jgi:lysyl-tRNA synthetase class 1
VSDVAAGDDAQVLRILRDLTAGEPIASLAEVRPRLDRAQTWVAEYVPDEERTHVRAEPDRALLASLSDDERAAVGQLARRMGDDWSLDGLTTLLYGVPKLVAGLPIDAAPTAELKVAQRNWFKLLYRLLVSAETGPRLPTLLLALGEDKVRSLLGG